MHSAMLEDSQTDDSESETLLLFGRVLDGHGGGRALGQFAYYVAVTLTLAANLDGADNFGTRYLVSDACELLDKYTLVDDVTIARRWETEDLIAIAGPLESRNRWPAAPGVVMASGSVTEGFRTGSSYEADILLQTGERVDRVCVRLEVVAEDRAACEVDLRAPQRKHRCHTWSDHFHCERPQRPTLRVRGEA